jgi:hypothetical protein
MSTLKASLSIVLVLAGGAAAFGACDAYAPDLGDKPFLCEPAGSGAKRCPDGYDAVDVGPPNVCECQKAGGTGPSPDANVSGCNDDSQYEPNNDVGKATATPIGTGATTAEFDNMAICPAADVDVFKLLVPTAGTVIDARVSFNPAVGVLAVNILDGTGAMKAMGTMSGSQVRATFTTTVSGQYFVQVLSASGQNNYNMMITTN